MEIPEVENNAKLLDGSFTKAFIFVKNWCPHSVSVAGKLNNATTYCFDLITSQFVECSNLHHPLKQQENIDAAKKLHREWVGRHSTVPLIFVYTTEWRYVGGEDDYNALTAANRRSATTGPTSLHVKF